MFGYILEMNGFNYKKLTIQDFIEEKYTNEFYLIHCEYLLIDKNEEKYNFLLKSHGKLIIVTFIEFEKYFYIININSIDELKDYIEKFELKITKLSALFVNKKIENINECFNNNIFKITDNYEIIINLRYHDNLVYFNNSKEEVINSLFSIDKIIENNF